MLVVGMGITSRGDNMRGSFSFFAFFPLFFTGICFPVLREAVPRAAFVVTLTSKDMNKEPQGSEFFLNTYSPEEGSTCYRTFQGLFSQHFIVDDNPDVKWVRVQPLNCYFAASSTSIQPLYYWAQRKELLFWDELSSEEKKLFPEPIDYRKLAVPQNGIVTLSRPWKSQETGILFSAGTRFVFADGKIVFRDPVSGKKVTEFISASKYLVNGGKPISAEDKIPLFVSLLKKFARKGNKIVPYIWGGASFFSRMKDEGFTLKKDNFNGAPVKYWVRPNGKKVPDGFDCSGLVLLSAQMAAIPYFCRTAGTAGAVLKPLAQDELIRPGDLFVTSQPNHIFIAIGDDEIVEAASYSAGFGKVHRIKVKDRFVNASSYSDLQKLFFDKKFPIYKSVDGKKTFPSKGFVIVRFSA